MKTLAVSILALTMPAAAIAPAMAQDWTQDPLDAYMKVAAGFEPNPYSFDVYARGEFKPSIKDRGGEGCKGAVVSAPSVDIYFQNDEASSRPLTIEVKSSVDTVLLITGPDGGWDCIDDANGRNPGLKYDGASSGLYSVWVGTYSKSASAHRAVLTIAY